MEFSQRLSHLRTLVEDHLQKRLDEAFAHSAPSHQPDSGRLAAAMRDASLNGGKRLRPILVLECASLFDVSHENALNAAAAVEFVHCYSLVHDDLPCMDNDEMRRGQPTIWKAYDEWTAVLAGDGLLTLAFETLADANTHPEPHVRLALTTTLARASGASGMVQGQALDLGAEKRNSATAMTVDNILHLQSLKTGALIQAACEMGGHLGEASQDELASLKAYGDAIGLAFQIRDDLLDAEGDADVVGKATGKDASAGKATLVGLLGRDQALKTLTETLEKAQASIARYGNKAASLSDIARFVADRQH